MKFCKLLCTVKKGTITAVVKITPFLCSVQEGTGEKIPTAEDLQGFWDMVYLQVN